MLRSPNALTPPKAPLVTSVQQASPTPSGVAAVSNTLSSPPSRSNHVRFQAEPDILEVTVNPLKKQSSDKSDSKTGTFDFSTGLDITTTKSSPMPLMSIIKSARVIAPAPLYPQPLSTDTTSAASDATTPLPLPSVPILTTESQQESAAEEQKGHSSSPQTPLIIRHEKTSAEMWEELDEAKKQYFQFFQVYYCFHY
jgi:hypothetical protein